MKQQYGNMTAARPRLIYKENTKKEINMCSGDRPLVLREKKLERL